MTGEVDPALARLARENPLQAFLEEGGGAFIMWTSSCSTAPGRFPVITEQAATPRLYASIAAEYARLETSTLCFKKEKIGYLSDVYGRCVRTIRTALASST